MFTCLLLLTQSINHRITFGEGGFSYNYWCCLSIWCYECGYKRAKNCEEKKVVCDSKREAPRDAASTIPKGSIAGHYSKFINDTLDIMDVFSHIKSFYIVMDNAPIHNSDLVDSVIIERG